MKDTCVIAYPPGAYGTYLQWALTALNQPGPLRFPGGSRGNAHGFKGLFLHSIYDWRLLLATGRVPDFVRLHPKASKQQDMTANMDELARTAKSVILIYPDVDDYLLIMHNWLHKPAYAQLPRSTHWRMLDSLRPHEIYDRYHIDPTTPYYDMPNWVLRDYFATDLFLAWNDFIDWFFLDHYHMPDNCKLIFVSDLLDDFGRVLQEIQVFLCRQYQHHIVDILPIHVEYLSNQEHRGQQKLAEKIVDAVLQQIDFAWDLSSITIYTEAYIKNQLMSKGVGINCKDLTHLPNNVHDLKQLCYPL